MDALFAYGESTEAIPPSCPPHFWPHHGTTNGYRLGCRCEQCKSARRAYNKKPIQRQRRCDWCGQEFDYVHGLTGRKTCGPCYSPRKATRLEQDRKSREPRRCERCDAKYFYHRDSPHGTKYCGDCLIPSDWEDKKRPAKICPVCGAKHERQNKYGVCANCYSAMPAHLWASLYKHHASLEFALQFAETLSCAICSADVTRHEPDAKKRFRPISAIDHDHKCCPGSVSCGECLRGVLCRRCNVAIGYLKDSPEYSAAAAAYLAGWQQSLNANESPDVEEYP